MTVGVTRAILIRQEGNNSLSFLNQIKRICDYGQWGIPLLYIIVKDIFTTPIQIRMNCCVCYDYMG